MLVLSYCLGQASVTAAQTQTLPGLLSYPGIYRVISSVGVNARSAASLSGSVVTTVAPGTAVQVLGSVIGDPVSSNPVWNTALFNGQVVFIHSSLLQPLELPEQPPADTGADHPAVPANPNAPPAARLILNYLYSLPLLTENRVVSGQFGAYGDGTSRQTAEQQLQSIVDQTGLSVALTGMDYAQWDRSRKHDFSEPNGFLIDQWRMGSLVNISWHAPNPWTGGPSSDWENPDTEDPYDTRDVMLLLTPGTPEYDQWILMLDDIASGLQELEDNGVIVIWRPLHEMNGGWAWWQRQKPESFIALWRHMFNYFTYVKGLNNLLWAYSPSSNNNQWDRGASHLYPGDKYVDLVGLDKYMEIGENPLQLNTWGDFAELVAVNKPIGLFEFGPIPATGEGWNTVEYDYENLIRDIKQYYPQIVLFQAWEYVWRIDRFSNASGLLNDPWVITQDELPKWQNGSN